MQIIHYFIAIILVFVLLQILMAFSQMGSTSHLLFILLACGLVYLIYKRNKEINSSSVNIKDDALHITNLDKGGVLTFKNVGEDLQDVTLTVVAKHLYKQGDYSWYEYECDDGSDKKVWFDVDEDDEIIVSLVLKECTMDEYLLTPERLEIIDDKESGKVSNFKYEDSGSATFYRYCDNQRAEKLYYWDFVNANQMLSVEKWGKAEYKVYLSQMMKPHQIVILRNKV